MHAAQDMPCGWGENTKEVTEKGLPGCTILVSRIVWGKVLLSCYGESGVMDQTRRQGPVTALDRDPPRLLLHLDPSSFVFVLRYRLESCLCVESLTQATTGSTHSEGRFIAFGLFNLSYIQKAFSGRSSTWPSRGTRFRDVPLY